MGNVDDHQDALEAVAQLREEKERTTRERKEAKFRDRLAAGPARDSSVRQYRTAFIDINDIQTATNIRENLTDIEELAVSISEQGLAQPLVVRTLPDGGFELVAGRRRLEALRLLHADGVRVRCELVDNVGTDAEMFALMFIENIQRKDFTPMEYARGFRLLLDKNEGWTAAQLARTLGGDVTAKTVRKHLKLLKLPESVQARVDSGDLSFTFADLLHRGQESGQLTDGDVEDLAAARAEGNVSTAEVQELVLPKGKAYVPPPPENYEEISRELDAARWAGKSDRNESEAEYRGEGTDPTERALASVPGVKLPRQTIASKPKEYGARQLESYLLGATIIGMAPELAQDLDLPGGDVFEYVWNLAEHERADLAHEVSKYLIGTDRNLPESIFPR